MKKLTCLPAGKILPAVVFIFSLLLVPFSIQKVSAQIKKAITCEDFLKLSKTAECKYYAIKADQGIWCGDEEADIYLGDERAVYKDRPPDYSIAFDPLTCGNTGNETEQQVQPEVQESKQTVNSAKTLNNWIKDTFSDLDFEATETERLYGRTPEMTEAIINQYKEEQKALFEGSGESPYRLDIQKGDIAIKLPGQTEWSTLKQGDKIPSGSTIFTGMDSTTILSIRDKGVVQVQSFTEITVTEKGLEEAAKTGQTYTEIELQKGEIEVNIEKGIYPTGGGSSMYIEAVYTTSSVRGTHFWVKHDDQKKTDTIGVYEGTVEVKTKDGKTVPVSPNGSKLGIVIVAQKLSIVKLIFAGVVLIVAFAGAMFFIKRRK